MVIAPRPNIHQKAQMKGGQSIATKTRHRRTTNQQEHQPVSFFSRAPRCPRGSSSSAFASELGHTCPVSVNKKSYTQHQRRHASNLQQLFFLFDVCFAEEYVGRRSLDHPYAVEGGVMSVTSCLSKQHCCYVRQIRWERDWHVNGIPPSTIDTP